MAVEERVLSIKRDREEVQLPVMGLQEEGGKLSKLLATTFASGRFRLTPAQSDEAKDRLVEILSCLTRISGETAILMETLAATQRLADQSASVAGGV